MVSFNFCPTLPFRRATQGNSCSPSSARTISWSLALSSSSQACCYSPDSTFPSRWPSSLRSLSTSGPITCSCFRTYTNSPFSPPSCGFFCFITIADTLPASSYSAPERPHEYLVRLIIHSSIQQFTTAVIITAVLFEGTLRQPNQSSPTTSHLNWDSQASPARPDK